MNSASLESEHSEVVRVYVVGELMLRNYADSKSAPSEIVSATQPSSEQFSNISGHKTICFFHLFFFGGLEVLFVIILLCRPSQDSLQYSEVPMKYSEDCLIRTQDCESTIRSLTMSHHYSQ